MDVDGKGPYQRGSKQLRQEYVTMSRPNASGVSLFSNHMYVAAILFFFLLVPTPGPIYMSLEGMPLRANPYGVPPVKVGRFHLPVPS